MSVELENRLVLVGAKRFVIAPKLPADLVAVVRVEVKPGGLREDQKEVPGQDGVTRTFLGYADAEITAEIRIVDEDQLGNVRRLADLFRPKRQDSGAYKPVEIVHPAAQRWGIRNVYIFEIHESSWTSAEGMTITLSMREWQPTEKRKTKATKPIAAGAGAKAGDYSFLEGRDIAAPSQKGVKP